MTAVSCRGGIVPHSAPHDIIWYCCWRRWSRHRVSSRVEIDVLKIVYSLFLKTNPVPAFYFILFHFVDGPKYIISFVSTFLIEGTHYNLFGSIDDVHRCWVSNFFPHNQVYIPYYSHGFGVFIIVIVLYYYITLSSLIKTAYRI